MNSTPPCVSSIVIMDFSGRWKYLTESVSDLLGWEPSDLREHSFFELVHPDELAQVQQLHTDTIVSDKAAAVVYMRLKHKDAHKGYILSLVSWTVVYDKLVGSVSFYSPGGKAFHTSSTAQEITVITPAASNFEFRRWHDPPVAQSLQPLPRSSTAPRPPRPRVLPPPAELPGPKSPRIALLLDRFSLNCTVTHYSNHQLISAAAAMRRPFFDFVAREDEPVVRSWLEAIKTCGVNDRGHPSGGGFGYGRFFLCTEGRNSIAPETIQTPNRSQLFVSSTVSGWRGRHTRISTAQTESTSQISVDAIFSAHSDGLVCILRRAEQMIVQEADVEDENK